MPNTPTVLSENYNSVQVGITTSINKQNTVRFSKDDESDAVSRINDETHARRLEDAKATGQVFKTP